MVFLLLGVNAFCETPLKLVNTKNSCLGIIPSKYSGADKAFIDKLSSSIQYRFVGDKEFAEFTSIKGSKLIKGGTDIKSNIYYSIYSYKDYVVLWIISRDGSFFTNMDFGKCSICDSTGRFLNAEHSIASTGLNLDTTLERNQGGSGIGWVLDGIAFKIPKGYSDKIRFHFETPNKSQPWGTVRFPIDISCKP